MTIASAAGRHLLTAVIAVWALTGVLGILAPGALPPFFVFNAPVLLLTAIAILHGTRRYGWKGIGIYFVLAVVISNIYENSSIATGFPFGSYYHNTPTPKIFLVPWTVGLAFFAITYLGAQIAVGLMGEDLGGPSKFGRFAMPVMATFVAVGWDICHDPLLATFTGLGVYKHPGEYYGVPISNYAGWFLCCWSINQAFALVRRPAAIPAADLVDRHGPAIIWTVMVAQLALMWRGIDPLLTMTNSAGQTYRFADFLGTTTMLGFYVMVFAAVGAVLATERRRSTSLS